MDALVLAREATIPEEQAAREGLSLIRELEVANDDEQSFAADILREVKGKHHVLEEKRKSITVPLNVALREVNALFKPVLSALEEGEKVLKHKIAGYLAAREAANRQALETAARAETAAQASEALATVEDARPPEGVSVRYVWKFEVIAPDLVPAQYLSPDPVKIAQAVRESAERDGEPRPIPGVKIFKEPVVTSRRVS